MRQNKMNRIIAFLLIAVILSSLYVNKTLSKYVREVESVDNTRVAIWDINANEVTMNLFKDSYIDDETGILLAQAHNGDNIIAPGTSGESLFSIVNHESDVSPEVMYKVEICLDDSQIPNDIITNDYIQWRLDDGSWGTWDQLKISIYSLTGNASGVETYQVGELVDAFRKDKTHKIGWQWLISDVDINTMTNEDYSALLSVKVSAKQTDTIYHGAEEGIYHIMNVYEEMAPITIKSSAPLDEFIEVRVDDETLDPDDYDLTEGSTVVTLKESYLETLPLGNYTVYIVSKKQVAVSQLDLVDRVHGEVDINSIVHRGRIPAGGTYYSGIDFGDQGFGASINYYENAGTIYEAGERFPELQLGDIYVYGDYEYCYGGSYYDRSSKTWNGPYHHDGWGVISLDTTKTRYGKILHQINGMEISSINSIFSGCTNLEISPLIPSSVYDISYAYAYSGLTKAPILPDHICHMDGAFEYTKITVPPTLPDTVIDMGYAFLGTKIVNAPVIPETVTHIDGAFNGCQNLVKAPAIPASVENMSWAFLDCPKLTGEIEIYANPTDYEDAFKNTVQPITLTGSSTKLSEIAATGNNGNVTVKGSGS